MNILVSLTILKKNFNFVMFSYFFPFLNLSYICFTFFFDYHPPKSELYFLFIYIYQLFCFSLSCIIGIIKAIYIMNIIYIR